MTQGASRRSERRRRQSGRGFTLIELMTVLAIMAVLGVMILPELRGTFGDAVVRATARELVDACTMASSRAASLGTPHRVRIDGARPGYVVERAVDALGRGFTRAREVPYADGPIDERLRVRVRPSTAMGPEGLPGPDAAPREDAPPAASGDGVTFYPDGTADPKEFVVLDRDGHGRILRVNPVTARVRVVDLEEPRP